MSRTYWPISHDLVKGFFFRHNRNVSYKTSQKLLNITLCHPMANFDAPEERPFLNIID